MKLIIKGRPVPAVRMTQRSKYKDASAQKYLAYKELIGWEAKIAGARLSHAPQVISAQIYIDCTKRDMDVDNVAKSLLDGLNGIAYHDDRQVIDLHVKKFYVDKGNNEYAEIEILEVTA